MDDRVRLPRKLAKSVTNGVLAEVGRLHPVDALQITLNMQPLHRVSMALSENELPLAMHDLVEVYNHKGSVGIYWVTKISNRYRKRRQFELAHGLDVFSASHFNSIEEFSGTVATFLQKVVNAQTQTIGGVKYWQLGTVADTNPWNKSIKYDNLMECLTEIAKKEEDYVFTFDQSTFPWTLNFVARDNTVLSEFRLNRNTENCTADLSDEGLCTRLFLSVTTESTETVTDDDGVVHVAGKKTQEGYYTYDDTAAQADWGVVCKTAGVKRKDVPTDAALTAWVDGYFARHHAPQLTLTIDGEELNRLTGESIDEVFLTRMCRVALPDYATIFNERIVSVKYPDALRTPRRVTVSLSNKRQTAESAFSELRQQSGGAGGSASAAKDKADNNETDQEKLRIIYDLQVAKDEKRFAIIATEQWYEDMDDEGETLIGQYDAAFELTARKIVTALNVTGVQYDANGDPVVDQNGDYVFNGGNNSLSSQITQTAQSLVSLYTKTGANSLGQNETLYSKITQNATDISTLVTKSGINSLGQNETLYSQIAQNASRIALVVSSSGGTDYINTASIVAGINAQTGSYVAISADKIDLTGYVQATDLTTNWLSSMIADIALVHTQYLYCDSLNVGNSQAGVSSSGNIWGNYITASLGLTFNGSNYFNNCISSASVSNDGTTLTLSWANGGTPVTFSKAPTLSGAWGGTTTAGKYYTVTASMNGSDVAYQASGNVQADFVPVYNSSTHEYDITYYAYTGLETLYLNSDSTGTAAYDDGYGDADAASIVAGNHVDNSTWMWYVNVTRADGTTKSMQAQCQIPWQNGYWNATPVSGTALTYSSGWNWNTTITGQGTGVTFSDVPINCQVPYNAGWNGALDAAVVYTVQRAWYGRLYDSHGNEVGAGSWYVLDGEYGTIYPTTLPARKT